MKHKSDLFRKPWRWAWLMAGSAALLMACGGQPPAPEEEEPPAEVEGEEAPDQATPDDLTLSADLLLDPALAADEDSQQVNTLLYDTLTRLEGGEAVPGLATEWRVSDDGLDWVFNLRPDATFQDGSPVNADAVLANFNRWFDPESPLRGGGSYAAWQEDFAGFRGEEDADGVSISNFDGIEKVDNLTVLLHLTRPMPDLPAVLAEPAYGIVSPEALAANLEGYGTLGSLVDGSGLYTLNAWGDGSLVLSPNPDYWGELAADELTFTLE